MPLAFDPDQSSSAPQTAWSLKRELTMPIANMLILTGIVLAFVFFAAVFAWGDYQTRLVSRDAGQHARASVRIHSLKQAAQDVGRKGPAVASGPIQQAAQYSPQPGTDRAINQSAN
jgi:hypothetical protein